MSDSAQPISIPRPLYDLNLRSSLLYGAGTVIQNLRWRTTCQDFFKENYISYSGQIFTLLEDSYSYRIYSDLATVSASKMSDVFLLVRLSANLRGYYITVTMFLQNFTCSVSTWIINRSVYKVLNQFALLIWL